MIEGLVESMVDQDYFARFAVQVALVREPETAEGRPQLSSPRAVSEAFKKLADLDRECVAVALLDNKHRLNAIHAVHIGTCSQSLVGVADVFKAAILANAQAVVLVHNHPSGDPEPSIEDRELTRRLSRAGEMLGIELLDHVVVAKDGYVSMKERCGI